MPDFDGLDGITDIILFINSTGGNFYTTKKIYELLKQHPAPKHGVVVTYCASGASVILMACDFISMPKQAILNFHLPRTSFKQNFEGFASDFRREADLLDELTDFLIKVYGAKSKLPTEKIKELLNDCVYLSGAAAYSLGFCDEVVEEFVCLIPSVPKKL